jgi:hypothetical protein
MQDKLKDGINREGLIAHLLNPMRASRVRAFVADCRAFLGAELLIIGAGRGHDQLLGGRV